eukprot:Transcript_11914.p2 GENE.Transcript_11914~~Transcript_11914.p2  ORF type:complete len:303 (-),score=111.67 Transcript_11914:114-1022(-)
MIAVANAVVASWLPAPSHPRASRSIFLRLGGPILMADAGEPDLDLLDSRIREVREGLTDCKLYVMYCMVPGQRLTVTAPPEVVTLFTDAPTSETRWMQERPDPVVALGRDKMNVHMTGVELRLKKLTPRPVVPNIHPEGTADLVLEAGRVCEVRTLDATPMQHRWLGRPARGKWVELDAWREVSADVLARSERLGTMAEEWMGLVRGAARGVYGAQLDSALRDLGPMPDADRPNTRALWVAGLINPVGGWVPMSASGRALRGLALEVRPEALMAPSVDARLRAVERVLANSLAKLQAGDFDI